MSITNIQPSHIHLDFNEANIITENSRLKDRTTFMKRISDLAEYTTDPSLLRCLTGLAKKLSGLSDKEFQKLMQDAENGDLLFPANYALPLFSELSL